MTLIAELPKLTYDNLHDYFCFPSVVMNGAPLLA
jgi:hypothetical protein